MQRSPASAVVLAVIDIVMIVSTSTIIVPLPMSCVTDMDGEEGDMIQTRFRLVGMEPNASFPSKGDNGWFVFVGGVSCSLHLLLIAKHNMINKNVT